MYLSTGKMQLKAGLRMCMYSTSPHETKLITPQAVPLCSIYDRAAEGM